MPGAADTSGTWLLILVSGPSELEMTGTNDNRRLSMLLMPLPGDAPASPGSVSWLSVRESERFKRLLPPLCSLFHQDSPRGELLRVDAQRGDDMGSLRSSSS